MLNFIQVIKDWYNQSVLTMADDRLNNHTPISKRDLGNKAYRLLERLGVGSMEELSSYSYTELKLTKGVGNKTMAKFQRALDKYDLTSKQE